MESSMHGDSTTKITAATAPGEIEKTLLQIWSDVLNMSDIDIHEDFLSLGGDSMAAMRCINRISNTFGVILSLDLFLLESAPVSRIASEITKIRLDADNVVAP